MAATEHLERPSYIESLHSNETYSILLASNDSVELAWYLKLQRP